MNDLQAVILRIFKDVSKICDKHNLRYFAIGGTAIGAVRHGGFIPWDDDLDIAMPIEDYQRFLSIASEELPDQLQLLTPLDSRHYESVFCKVMDCGTTLIQKSTLDYPDRYTGAWVDVMPMSGLPDSEAERRRYIRKLKMLLKAHQATCHRLRGGTFKHRTLKFALLPVRHRGQAGMFYRAYCKELTSNSFDTSRWCGYTWSFGLAGLVFPKEWFVNSVPMPFEDTIMRMPVGYDAYLTQQFGDYMTIPPESERATHEAFVDLGKSYKEYASGKLKIPDGYFDVPGKAVSSGDVVSAR